MEASMAEKEKVCEVLDYAKDWDQWRATLKEAIGKGRAAGLSDETIQKLSVKVGDFLVKRVCAETKEEELLREMWQVAEKDERKTLARLIFKMVS